MTWNGFLSGRLPGSSTILPENIISRDLSLVVRLSLLADLPNMRLLVMTEL